MCETILTDKEIARSHNGRSFVVKNEVRWQVGVVEVDDCLITDTKRCDWMVRLPGQKKIAAGIAAAKLVELKGSDVAKAFAQLEATLIHPHLTADRPLINECFIVSKINPSFSGTIQIQKKHFADTYGLTVHVGSIASIDVENP